MAGSRRNGLVIGVGVAVLAGLVTWGGVGVQEGLAQDDDRPVYIPPWLRDREAEREKAEREKAERERHAELERQREARLERDQDRERGRVAAQTEPVEVVVLETERRWEYAKLIYAKRNAPTHQLLYYGPGGDYIAAANPSSLARQLFGRRHNLKHPDDLVNVLGAYGWELVGYDAAAFRGGGLDIDREYWMFKRPVRDRRRR